MIESKVSSFASIKIKDDSPTLRAKYNPKDIILFQAKQRLSSFNQKFNKTSLGSTTCSQLEVGDRAIDLLRILNYQKTCLQRGQLSKVYKLLVKLGIKQIVNQPFFLSLLDNYSAVLNDISIFEQRPLALFQKKLMDCIRANSVEILDQLLKGLKSPYWKYKNRIYSIVSNKKYQQIINILKPSQQQLIVLNQARNKIKFKEEQQFKKRIQTAKSLETIVEVSEVSKSLPINSLRFIFEEIKINMEKMQRTMKALQILEIARS